MANDNRMYIGETRLVYIIVGFIVFITLFWLFIHPVWKVWKSGLTGKAELRRAEQNRQIAIEEAKAKKESAGLLNEAEVIRAAGLAKATDLVVNSFGGPDAYLRYLWIQSIENNKADVIYVPTEAGLPILEATRRIESD